MMGRIRSKTSRIALLLCLMLLTTAASGCRVLPDASNAVGAGGAGQSDAAQSAGGDASENGGNETDPQAASADGSDKDSASTDAAGPASTGASEAESTDASKSNGTNGDAVEADWVVEINDSQTYTDADGVLWTQRLSMYVKKTGGTDPVGEYAGDIVLTIEPDLDSVAAMLKKEGDTLESMYFHYEAESVEGRFSLVPFEADEYASLMKEAAPNQPGMQMTGDAQEIDAMAIQRMTFHTTQSPIVMAGKTEDGDSISGSVGGRSKEIDTPFLLTTNGATAYVQFPEPIFPLDRAFRGTVTGTPKE